MATITGTTGDDVLVGTTGDDVFTNFVGGSDLLIDLGGYDTVIINRNLADLVNEDYDEFNFWLEWTGARVTLFGDEADDSYVWPMSFERFVLNDYIFEVGTDADELFDHSFRNHAVGIEAGGGADTVVGTAFDDDLEGGSGNDVINAGAGDDMIWWSHGDGSDYIDGGAGYDTVELNYFSGFEGQGLGIWFDGVSGEGYADIEGQEVELVNVERVITEGVAQVGTAGNDMLVGVDGQVVLDDDSWTTSTSDTLVGLGGNDTMDGGVGDDTYYVDSLGDVIIDAQGFDTVVSLINYTLAGNLEGLVLEGMAAVGTGNAGGNWLIGNDGDNTLNGLAGSDTLFGGDGDDVLDGGTGADTMDGGVGDDTYYIDNALDVVMETGWESFDVIHTTVGIDMRSNWFGNIEQIVMSGSANLVVHDVNTWDNRLSVIGNSGANTIYGYDGNDLLDGGAGADSLFGGAGSDVYYVDNAADKTKEVAGEGIDTVFASLTWTLANYTEHLVLGGTANINGNGNTLANMIIGNAGNNNLRGNQGADTLYGGDGSDTLNGGGGADILVGGAGADRFLFSATLGGANIDRISSFTVGSDRLQLDDEFFVGLTVGTLAASQFRYGTNAGDADDRVIYDTATGSLYYDADGNGAGFKTKFATLDDKALITAADIQIV